MRRRDQREFPARDVAGDAFHRQVPVAQDDARQGLDFQVQERRLLRFGEAPDLFLGEGDVGRLARRQLVETGLDFRIGQPETLRIPAVEPFAQLAHRRLAPRLDLVDDADDDVADLLLVLGPMLDRPARLENFRHGFSSAICPRATGRASVLASGAVPPDDERRRGDDDDAP